MIRKNHLKFLISIFLLISVESQKIYAQCTPLMEDNCYNAPILCSLDELDGYACNNSGSFQSSCATLCSQGGLSENTSWWGFITNGGNVSVTLTVGNCANNQGLEFGIFGYTCSCAYRTEVACHSVPCVPPGGVETISATLNFCGKYYLWVDGCVGDVCDFTINTSGGGPPVLPPFGPINDEPSGILPSVCVGNCNTFFVKAQNDICNPYYVWELNGNKIDEGKYKTQIKLVFPGEGDFTLCVTSYVRNLTNPNVICSQQGPRCANIKVTKLPDRFGTDRIICWEAANPGGYNWHSQKIHNSGTYVAKLLDSKCCYFDSIVNFTILNKPDPAIVYFISCNNQPYFDIVGKSHPPCLKNRKVSLPKTTYPHRCDSSIILTAINSDFAPSWSTRCQGGMVELIPNIIILESCQAGETYEFEYSWYKNSDTSHVISKEERLLVNSISEEYCLKVTVVTQIESEIGSCTKIFCESIDEGNLAPYCSFSLAGNKVYCFDPIAAYRLDSLFLQKVNFYSWSIDGGTIVSNPDSSRVEVKWSLNPQDTGKICASYNTDCGMSCEKCLTVLFETQIAGQDFEKRGLSAYLDAKPNKNGTWRLISGPNHVTIEDSSNPRTKITAYNYGYYCFEWTVSDSICVMKDTLCVNLHSFKKASPQYSDHLIFEERSKIISNKDQSTIAIFTPNLIVNSGESFMTINVETSSKITYRWFDIYGRVVAHDNIFIESGIQRMNIHSPIHEGMYFLVVERNGVTSVRKVCVIE